MPSHGRVVTLVQAILLAVALALTAYLANLVFQPRPQVPRSVAPAGVAGPQRRGMGRRGFPQPERRILKDHQQEVATDEARSAREADAPAEERTHRRRSEKAAYLRDKLAEAEESCK